MFYGEESFSPFIKCQLCKTKLTEAKILPCDHFCKNCVDELTENADKETKEFICKSCDETHTIPKNGFKSWKALNEFYSKELNIQEIYRGETAEDLKKNLEQIRKQIDDFDLALSTSSDSVKEHCLKLINEISLEAEVAIKQIHDVRDELIAEVRKYQTKCISNFESDMRTKQKFNQFSKRLKHFYTEWSEYLNKYHINDAEMLKANYLALKIEKTFKDEKINLEKFIFNDKTMNFRKNQPKSIDKTFLGYFEFKAISAFDINKYKMIQLNVILGNLNARYARSTDLDSFKDQKFSIAYPDTSGKITVAIIDKNQKISKSTQTNLTLNSNHPAVKLKSIKGLIILFCNTQKDTTISPPLFGGMENSFNLSTINSNLKLLKSIDIENSIISIDANETSIYCLTNDNKIMIFDHQLNKAKTIDTISNNPLPYFTFGNSIIQIIHKSDKFYCLYLNRIEILNDSNNNLIKSIDIKGSKMAFDSGSNLLILSYASSKIYKYNLDGVLQREIDLENVPTGLDFCVDEEDDISYFNKSSKCLYFDQV